MIHMRLRVDWWVICQYLAIQIPMSISEEKGVKRGKSSFISFLPRNLLTLLFSCHLSTSRRFWNFSMILTTFFTLLSDPSKWVWPRLAKNLNCKYNYLIPRIQLSWKNWVGRSLGGKIQVLRGEKLPDFSSFDIWWVIGGRGYHISESFVYQTIAYGLCFRLSPWTVF